MCKKQVENGSTGAIASTGQLCFRVWGICWPGSAADMRNHRYALPQGHMQAEARDQKLVTTEAQPFCFHQLDPVSRYVLEPLPQGGSVRRQPLAQQWCTQFLFSLDYMTV